MMLTLMLLLGYQPAEAVPLALLLYSGLGLSLWWGA